MQTYLQCGRYRLPVDGISRPLVMGILNVTPDSFSDGGRYQSLEWALSRAEEMIAAGVDIIDIGGESSRPGAPPLPVDEELRRIMPVLYALRDCGKPISVDTYKPEVMREAITAGADMINDIKGFREEHALSSVKESDCALCIMHMQHNPVTMQHNPDYDDVVSDVIAFLRERLADTDRAGIGRDRICIDPGFGFGKTQAHNVALLQNLATIQSSLELPLLAGMSRKSMIGGLTDQPIEKRLAGSLGAALAAAAQGARILRVHDVAETIDALRVWQAALTPHHNKDQHVT
ncbi:MAG: dihydropteroate synthase [Herminiimonas sp.]|nr:dihydropteroate synthase [Herminiimonas sp.]